MSYLFQIKELAYSNSSTSGR